MGDFGCPSTMCLMEVGKTFKRKRDRKIAVITSVDNVRKTVLLEFADGENVVQTFPTMRTQWVSMG